jgi:chromosome segregation ATPase
MGAYERIQERLLDHGRFQLEQTLILQDDEIERLKTLKKQTELRISRGKIEWMKDRRDLESQIGELITRLQELESEQVGILRSIRAEQPPKIRKLVRSHSVAMEQVRTESRFMRTETTESIDTQDDEAFAETLRNLSVQVESTLSEKQDQTSQKIAATEATLARLGVETKAHRTRAEQLSIQVERLRGQIDKSRKSSASVLDDLEGRIEKTDASISSSQSHHRSAISEMSRDTVDREALEPLRNQLSVAHSRVKRLNRDIRNAQKKFAREIGQYEEEKAQLTASLEEDRNQLSRAEEYAAKLAEELERIRMLQEQLPAYNAELQKLRDTNLDLLRKVNQLDYDVNGRSGAFQRASKLTASEI